MDSLENLIQLKKKRSELIVGFVGIQNGTKANNYTGSCISGYSEINSCKWSNQEHRHVGVY